MTESSPFLTHPIHQNSTLHEMHLVGREISAYRFMLYGREYVYKLYNKLRFSLPVDIEAAQMNKMHGILKSHYGDEIVDTLFFVAQETRNETPRVACIQSFIIGTTGYELWTSRQLDGLEDKLQEWKKKWGSVQADPGFQELSLPIQEHYSRHDFNIFNCFRAYDGRYIFFDW